MKSKRVRALVTGIGLVAAWTLLPGQAQAAQPDLVVTAVSLSPATPATGQAVTFTATIKNQGTGASPAGVKHGVQFQVDGALKTWSDTWTTSLAPGASTTVTANGGPNGATWAATAGNHTLNGYVDDAKRIAESNESNNILSKPFTVTSAPALTTRVRVARDGAGYVFASQVGAYPSPSYVLSQVTGTLYAACFRSDGTEVIGTDRQWSGTSVGNSTTRNAKFAGGHVDVPASATTLEVRAWADSAVLVWLAQNTDTMTCPTGSTGAASHFHATQQESVRYVGDTVISRYTAPIDVDVQR